MSKTKRCNHKMTRYDWGRDTTGAEVAVHRWCLGCGTQMGLGPSNDDPEQVQMDIDMAIARDIIGVNECDAWDDGDYFDFDQCDSDWSWDPLRPIAEQLAETARNDAEADAMEYEVTRAAEPDCRDEDAHTASCDTLTDDAFPCNCEARVVTQERMDAFGAPGGGAQAFRDALHRDQDEAQSVVCSCAGDALRSERCEGKS